MLSAANMSCACTYSSISCIPVTIIFFFTKDRHRHTREKGKERKRVNCGTERLQRWRRNATQLSEQTNKRTIRGTIADHKISKLAFKMAYDLFHGWQLGNITLWYKREEKRRERHSVLVSNFDNLLDAAAFEQQQGFNTLIWMTPSNGAISCRSTATILASSSPSILSTHTHTWTIYNRWGALVIGGGGETTYADYPLVFAYSFLLRTWLQLPGAAHKSTARTTPAHIIMSHTHTLTSEGILGGEREIFWEKNVPSKMLKSSSICSNLNAERARHPSSLAFL